LGANSSGKSSALEAVDLNSFQNNPHRSVLNCIDALNWDGGFSSTEQEYSLSREEAINTFQPSDCIIWLDDGLDLRNSRSDELIEAMERGPYTVSVQRSLSNSNSVIGIGLSSSTFIQKFPLDGLSNVIRGASFNRDAKPSLGEHHFTPKNKSALWNYTVTRIYRFFALRVVNAACVHTPTSDLQPDLGNLAYCINVLQSTNPNLHAQLNRLLKRVFPTIYGAYAPPHGNNQFELKIHFNDQALNRGDLAVPLNQVGIGVANAIGMLYIALTSQSQRIILLEEPNSYLHPRALKELLAILVEVGSKHQYFVTTHSSDVLKTIDASSVTLLSNDGTKTTVSQVFDKKLHSISAGLTELGITLTDLHGCDKVLWVEGQTEEAVFPMLLKHFFAEQAQGIACLPLYATGDFESRRYEPKKVASIYKTLSEGNFLAPPLVAIILDREMKSPNEIKTIESESQGIVQFLPKVMLEDYVLVTEAIASVLNEEESMSVEIVEVENALRNALENPQLRLTPQNTKSTQVHAAKVLKSLFHELGTIEYKKTFHGPKLFKWLIDNSPEKLDELKEFLRNILERTTAG
jgi:hypothetical protein